MATPDPPTPTPEPGDHYSELPETKSLGAWRDAAAHCRACDLWKDATQTVFGEGRPTAKVVFVGEQPGDKEDIAGKPFVGPAGRVLDPALEAARIDRDAVYVTNAVDHCESIHGALHRTGARVRRGLTHSMHGIVLAARPPAGPLTRRCCDQDVS